MYSPFVLLKKFIRYYFTSSNGKGHGIHSPFVFDFIKNVLNDKTESAVFKSIEERRKALLQNRTLIKVQDFGAGSGVIKTHERIVADIAASSLKPKKYAQLLFRIIKYYRPVNIVELGTSFGTTAAYLAKASAAKVYTLEGDPSIAGIASDTFKTLNIENAELITGAFSKTLPKLLENIKRVGFAFIDGNHKKIPTLLYYDELLKYSDSSTIFIFDDIHWSTEMEEAWDAIKLHNAVTLTIDLFFIGIVLFRKDFKVKQHFVIRF